MVDLVHDSRLLSAVRRLIAEGKKEFWKSCVSHFCTSGLRVEV